MASARRVWRLHAALALAGAAALVSAMAVALTRIDFSSTSAGEIAAACRQWAFPYLDAPAVAVLLVGSLCVAAVILVMREAWQATRATRRFQRSLSVQGFVPGQRDALLVEDPRPRAFCVGLLRPRVYLSRGAVSLLDRAELRAVLAHERHHLRRRDPLRLLVARSLGEGLFFLPVLRRLAERYAALAEVAADEAAVGEAGQRPLASALLRFDSHPSPAVGIAPERVDHLLGERTRWELPTLLVLGAVATIGALVALAIRLAQASGHASVSLPDVVAQACMLAMAIVPLLVGAAVLLSGRRLLRR